MFKGKELIWGLERLGRWNVQEFVTRSRDMTDVLTYLKAEKIFELMTAAEYLTKDSINFEKRKIVPFLVMDKPQNEEKIDLEEFEFQVTELDSRNGKSLPDFL